MQCNAMPNQFALAAEIVNQAAAADQDSSPQGQVHVCIWSTLVRQIVLEEHLHPPLVTRVFHQLQVEFVPVQPQRDGADIGYMSL